MTRTLEDRIREVEDRLDIFNLVAAHPPMVDSGSDALVLDIFSEDAVFDYGTFERRVIGPADIAQLLRDGGTAVDAGMGHCSALPIVKIDGDQAEALSYIILAVVDPSEDRKTFPKHGDSAAFRIFRTVLNHWRFERTAAGWRICRRVSRTVGDAACRELLQSTVGAFFPLGAGGSDAPD